MLYALAWIRVQLTVFYGFVEGFFRELTLGAVTSFIGGRLAITILFILSGLLLTMLGFRSYKLLSSLAGAAVMGVLGWYLGFYINPELLNASILIMFIFIIAGLPIFYALSSITAFLIPFLLCFVILREFTAISIGAGLLAAAAAGALYCIFLLRRTCVRTSIEGGIIAGLAVLYLSGYYYALGVFVACAAGGSILQHFQKKRYDERMERLRDFRPNAPSPPTQEEISKEIEEEAAERLLRKREGLVSKS